VKAARTIARNELSQMLRSDWLLLYAALFGLLALGLSYVGQRNLGDVGFQNFSRTTASLLNLCLLLTPLIALLLGSGVIAGLRDRGTLTYLLSQPISPQELLLGKTLGVLGSVVLANTMGFGIAGIVIGFYAPSLDAGLYLMLWFLMLALAAVMVVLGVLSSVIGHSRAQATGLALVGWFVFVLLFDLVLIGFLSATSIGGTGMLATLLLNPVEIVRVLAIMHLEPELEVLGPFGAYLLNEMGLISATVLLSVALFVWLVTPTAAALWLFHRDHE
jgi:Cu-processing system permease protein